MKSFLTVLFLSTPLLAQPISFGIKAGVPMTDFLNTVNGSRTSITTTTNRYIVGPTVELRLPLGFGVEADALYRHFRFNAATSLVDIVSSFGSTVSGSLSTSASAWEFPLLVKKRFAHGPIRPFVGAGVSFNKITGVSQTVQGLVFPSHVADLQDDFSKGFVIGGGVELKALLLKITPEIRYTRWGTTQFNSVISGGTLRSNVNQAEFLVGITF
jgi:opacity protein-like surface antigen